MKTMTQINAERRFERILPQLKASEMELKRADVKSAYLGYGLSLYKDGGKVTLSSEAWGGQLPYLWELIQPIVNGWEIAPYVPPVAPTPREEDEDDGYW